MERDLLDAARGGIRRDVLERLVDEGLSVRRIAERVEMSQSTVRHLALPSSGSRSAGATVAYVAGPRL
jgi:DNA-binding transcriptional ArsR family regulator